jgi:hypothetical protein
VLGRAGVIGSMIGVKVRRGRALKRPTMTFLVREKVAVGDLAPEDRIPSRLVMEDGEEIETDVIVWPDMAHHGLEAARILTDTKRQGALTGFGRSQFGVFGVTCAHCLAGQDDNVATPTLIKMYGANPPGYLPAGRSLTGAFSPGGGTPGNFGYLDCGLFTLTDDVLAARAENAVDVGVVDDLNEVLGQVLQGESPLNAPNWTGGGTRTATVLGVNAAAIDEYCDIVLQADDPGLFHGDSGLLWRTADGRAAAIHARGELAPSLQGSHLISGMSASRAAAMLQVTLLVG